MTNSRIEKLGGGHVKAEHKMNKVQKGGTVTGVENKIEMILDGKGTLVWAARDGVVALQEPLSTLRRLHPVDKSTPRREDKNEPHG